MELVPGKLREFRQRGYWTRFYAERAPEEVMEWYGTIADVKPLFQSELNDTEKTSEGPRTRGTGNSPPQRKPTRNVSVLSCGFGSLELAERLHDDLAIRDICTLHGSAATVAGMEQRNAHKRPDLKFVALATKLTDAFGPASYDWVIDRGSFDHVMMSTPENEASIIAERHLENAFTVLRPNGKLMLITLGQGAILKALATFLKNKKLVMRLYPIGLRENGMNANVFDPLCFVIQNRPDPEKSDHPMVTVDWRFSTMEERGTTARVSIYQIFKVVKDERKRAYAQANIIDYHPGNLIFFDLIGSDSKGNEMSYSLSAYDRTYPRFASAEKRSKFLRTLRPTIAILAPQADQHHWLYKTVHGHQRLCERAGCRRVICVFLPDFGPMSEKAMSPTETVNKIKEDLTRSLIELAVDKRNPVLLMTQQENFCDERIPVHKCESGHAGKILVFDAVVDEDDEEFKEVPEDDMNAANEHKPARPSKYKRRTMIFECNPRMAQTEVWYTNNNGKIEFDYLHICHAYHLLLLAGLHSLNLTPASTPYTGALLGLGGGMLACTLKAIFGEHLNLTSVELDPAVAEIAQKHFGFQAGPSNNLVITDGAGWVLQHKGPKLDFLIVDINASQGEIGAGYEGVSCPPAVFLSEEFLTAAANALKDNGVMLINSVCHQSRGRDRVVQKLREVFKAVATLKYSEDLNEAIMCYKQPRQHAKTEGLEDLIPSTTQDIRVILNEMKGAWPTIQKVMEKTPMYLSKYARFNAVLEHF